MLRVYFLQQRFNLSDPATEEALYDIASMRSFAKIDLGREGAPDETTVCKFRHLLERQKLGPEILREVNAHLKACGVKISSGTIVDATIVHAPSSTKNSSGKRDPEMHQTKKGNEWFFGMKAHIGVHSRSKIGHSFVATPANEHDSRVLPDLLHGGETRVWGDSAYRGQTAVIRARSEGERLHATALGAYQGPKRSRTEDQSHEIARALPRRIAKNGHRLWVNFALANLYLSRRGLLPQA